jgi:hypothetical protein
MNTYNEGQRIKITVHFTDADTGVSVDPTTVRFCTLDPENISTCYTYGVGPLITKTAVGKYRFDLLLSKHGSWIYAWFASGNYDGVAQREVYACQLAKSTWPTS